MTGRGMGMIGSGRARVESAIGVAVALITAFAVFASSNAGAVRKFSDWSAATNLGPMLNSAGGDAGPVI